MQRVEPAHLVGELLAAHSLPVRKIGGHDAHVLDGRSDHALLRILEAGDIAHDIGFVDAQAIAYQNADAVVGLLAGEPAFVADGRKFSDGELVVGEFEFLQAQHVDATRRQPVDDMLLADFEGVDVPGGDFHK